MSKPNQGPRPASETPHGGLPAKYTPPRVKTFKAEELEEKELIIHAGSPDEPFG